MDTISTIDQRASRQRLLGNIWQLSMIAIDLYDRIAERHRSRVALLELNDAQLKDIGLSRADAWREGVRPFWD